MKRGNLLWTGSRMMLSEHRQAINERLRKEVVEEDVIAEIDAQLFEQWQEVWEEATTNGKRVTIRYKKNKLAIGHITGWNAELGFLYLEINEGERMKILMGDIIDFKIN